METPAVLMEIGTWIVGLFLLAVATIPSIIISHVTKKKLAQRDAKEKEQEEANLRLKELLESKKNDEFRNMVLKEIEPVVAELHKIETTVAEKEQSIKDFHNADEELIKAEISDLKKKIDEIVFSYKFRLIRLCNIHINDGWISSRDFDQLSAFYDVYTRLGGNGQAKDYYERVKLLPNKPEDIIQN